jgi:hypothetical protein
MMRESRQAGALLLELNMALAVFAVGVLAYFSTFQSMSHLGQDALSQDQVQLVFRNLAADLRNADFRALYTNFDGALVDAPGLKAQDGSVAKVDVTCYVDETALPAEFGPVLDLDGDGIMSTRDTAHKYKVLPVKLALTYATGYGSETREMFLVITDA